MSIVLTKRSRAKRQPVSTFQTEGVKKVKLKTKDNKVKELGLTCGIFGRMCCLALEKKLDLDCVLQYSLTPLPLSLAHIGGLQLTRP